MLYLVISGAPAPEGIPELVGMLDSAGWRVVVFATPAGVRFADTRELERLTGQPVRSEYRAPGTGTPVPPADVVLACPLTFNSVNKFAHGHADNFAISLLCEMAGYGVPCGGRPALQAATCQPPGISGKPGDAARDGCPGAVRPGRARMSAGCRRGVRSSRHCPLLTSPRAAS